MKNFFSILLSKEQKKYLILGAIGGVLYSAMLVAIPFLIGEVLRVAGKLRVDNEKRTTVYLIAGILIFSLVTMCIYSMHRFFVNKFILSLRLALEQKYIKKIINIGGESSKIINVVNEDIKDICELHYQNIFKVVNSGAFILMGMIYSLGISLKAFVFELIFVCISFLLQIKSKKLLNEKFKLYRNARIKEINKITSYISSKLTFITNNACYYVFRKVEKLISQKAEEEYKFFLTKSNINLILRTLPTIGTLVCCLILYKDIVYNKATRENGLTLIYIIGYILWEVIKLVNVRNDYAALKQVECELQDLILNSEPKNNEIVKNSINKFNMENVTVMKEEKVILNNISFTFQDNKKYILIGKSGSGKSTLIKAITKQIDYYGEINGKTSKEYTLNKEINYLPQQSEMIPENIYLNVAISRKYDKAKVRSSIAAMNLNTENITSNIDCLSGGEIKKIEFARSLYYSHRKTWILDEPFEGVDIDSRKNMEEIIKEYKGSMLLASHIYTKDIIEIFDEVLIFEDGNLVFSGKITMMPKSLFQYYFSEEYIA